MFKEHYLIFQNAPSERPELSQKVESVEKSTQEQYKEALQQNKTLLENTQKELQGIDLPKANKLKHDIDRALTYIEKNLNKENLNTEKTERALTEITNILERTEGYLRGKALGEYAINDMEPNEPTLSAEKTPTPELSQKEASKARGKEMAKTVIENLSAEDLKNEMLGQNTEINIPPLEK
ncbi:MAG: hypothetical protein RBS56_02130 [Candidatus Gracilibacteria bacterium]|jgi:hypothetical protein|nr:hypothetical protein [Candidatus Gracilibacteria bacterium]